MRISSILGSVLLVFVFVFTLNNSAKAQTTLAKGDIGFTGYFGYGTATGNDQFSFVLLTNVTTNTVINFTDNGWIRTSSTTGSFRTGEGTVTWTSNANYNAGTEILITITGSTTATATLVGGASAGTATGSVMPSLSANGDQVIAYQGTTAAPTFISAIHMNVYTVAPVLPDNPGGDPVTTTTTDWDGNANTSFGSGLPALGGSNFLTNGVDAIWIPGSITAEKDNAKFNCAGPLGNAAQVRAAVNNVANWITSDNDPAPVTLPTGCSYITALPAPTITLNPVSPNLCAGSNTTLTFTATGATSYKWQVDNGGGFTDIINDATYSGATTTSLTITGVTNAMNGYIYRGVAINGSGSTNTTPATLTVIPLPANPTLLAKTPIGSVVADGTNVSATFNAGSGGTTCTDDYRYSTDGGATYLPYTPGASISTTGLAAGSGYVFIEGRRANCSSSCQNSYVVLASWQVSPLPASPTTLNAGDIAFSGYIGGNNVAADEFSFVLLKNIGAGTAINFTNTGWLSTNTFGAAEESVTWTAGAAMPAGSEIRIAGLTATRSGAGNAGTVTGTPLTLSLNGDQILAYRGSSASPTFISAIHMNVYSVANGDPTTTTAASWDGAATGTNASALPTGLTTGVNAIWIGTSGDINSEFDNAKFGNCSHPSVPGSISALRSALNNQANWIRSNGGDPATFTLPTGCNYLTVLCPTITVTNPATTTGVAGTPFNQTFTSTGGVNPITYTLGSGSLPSGLTLSTAGVLSGTPTVAGTFNITVTATDANGCSGTGATYSLVISCPTYTITATPPSQTICSGGAITTIVLANGPTGTVYNWTRNNTGSVTGIAANGVGDISGTLTNTTTAPVTVTFTITPSVFGCTGSPITATVVVNPTPTAVATPSSQTICSGGSITTIVLSGAVSGTTYNWTRNNTGTVTGIAGSGAGDISGSLTNTTNAPVTVTFTITPTANSCPGSPITATVVVNPTPTAVATPSSQTICSGGSITTIVLSGAVSGTTYNWTRNNTGTVTGIAASGSGNISGSLTNTTNAPVTVTFTITPTANSCPGTAITATVVVNPTPNAVATPSSQNLCSGGAITTIVLSGNVSGTTYSWTRNNTGTVTGIAASGSGDISGSLTNTTNAPVTVTFTITPTANSCPGTPITATVVVNPIPNAVATPASQTTCSGAAITTIAMSGNVSGTVYNWTRDNTVAVTGIGGSGSGNITGTLTNTTNAPVTVTFTITPTANGCPGSPITATVVVNPTPTVNAVSNQTVCHNTGTAAINFSGAVAGTVYTWTNNTPSIGLAANGTGNIGSFVANNTTAVPVTATITVTPSFTNAGATCTGTPITFTITVNPIPNVSATPASQTVCSNTAMTPVVITSTTPGASFAWTRDNTGAVTGISASGSGNITGTPVNTTNAPVTVTFTITPSFTGGATTCTGATTTVTMVVNPTPTVNAVTNQDLCNGASTTAISFSGNVTGTVYNWTNNAPSIGLAANGTGDIASFVAVNTGNVPVVATITVTPSYTNAGSTCTGTPITFTITVNPKAHVNPVVNQALCNGSATAAVNFTGNTSSTVYNWTNSAPSIGLAANGSGNIPSFNAVNTTGAPITATIVVTPSFTGGSGACAGDPITFTITVNPTPTVNAITNQTVCNNSSTAAVNFTGNAAGTVYSWTNNNTSIGLGANGTGNIPSFNGTNSGTAPVTATITVTPSYTNGTVTCTGAPVSFTITVNPTPTVNGVSNLVLCNGSNTGAFNFSGAVAGTVYNWTNNTTSIGLAGSGTGNIASFVATNTTNAPVTATITVTPTFTNGGTTCTGTPTTFTITVNPTPTVNAISNQTVCNTNSTAAVNFTGFVPGTVYSWTNNNTSIGLGANGTGNIPSFVATNSTNAPVTATITVTPSFTNGSVTCTGTPVTFTITVNPTPNAVATPSTQTICNNTAITTIVLSGAVSGTTYSWTRNNTANVTGIAASGSGNISGTLSNTTLVQQTVTFTITPTANGCPGAPITATVIVNPTPTVTCPANITVNNNPGICGAVVNYPPATATGVPAPVITYSIASGSTFPVGTTTVTVTATNSCAVVTCSFTVTVIDNQAPTITCPGNITRNTDPGVCTATFAPANPVTADNCAVTDLTWVMTGATTGTSPATGINNLGSRTFNIGTTTVTYTVKDAAGNSSTCSFTVTINDGQLPVISAQPVNNTSVCTGLNAVFSVTATNAVSYQWQVWNGSAWVNVAGATGSTMTLPNVLFSQNATTYRVQVIGLCTTITSNPATLRVFPPASVSIIAFPPAILPNQTSTLTAIYNNGLGTFVWSYNGSVLPGATGPTVGPLAATAAGTYKVVYTDPNGCVATSAEQTLTAIISNLVLVYPNPNYGQFHVRYYNAPNEQATVNVYNALGAKVYTKKFTTSAPYSELDISLGNVTAGVYTVEVVDGSGHIRGSKRILVVH